MAKTVEEIVLLMKADVDKALAGLQLVQKQTTATASGFTSMGKAVQALASSAAIAAIAQQTMKAVEAASGLEEAMNKFNVVFASTLPQATQGLKEITDGFGMTRQAAAEYMGTLGGIMKAMGLSASMTTAYSTQLVKLAADMASFNNTSFEEAFTAVKAGLTGETEPLKRFGVVLLDYRVQAEAAAMGFQKVNGELTEMQKIQARIALLNKDTFLQQGDFERTMGSWANQQKIFNANIQELYTTIGEALLPIFKEFIVAANSLFSPENMAEIKAWASAIISGFVTVQSAMMPLMGGIVSLAKYWWDFLNQIPIISDAMWSLKTVFVAVKDSVLELASAMGAVKSTELSDMVKGNVDQVLQVIKETTRAPQAQMAPKAHGKPVDQEKFREEYLAFTGDTEAAAQQKLTEHYNKLAEIHTKNGGDLLELERAYTEQLDKIHEDSMAKKIQGYTGMAQTVLGIAGSFASQMSSILEMQSKAESAKLDRNYKIRKMFIENVITDETQRAEALNALDLWMEVQKKQLARREFERSKAMQIVQATIQTIAGSVAGFTSAMTLPYPANIIAGAITAAAIAAFGAAQIAMIASQQAPAFAEGGLIKGSQMGTLIRAGEGGRSEAIIPFENPDAMGKMGLGGGQAVYNISFDGAILTNAELPRQFIEAIDRGMYRLKQDKNSVFARSM
jgi:hypothetical protein